MSLIYIRNYWKTNKQKTLNNTLLKKNKFNESLRKEKQIKLNNIEEKKNNEINNNYNIANINKYRENPI